MSPEQKCGGKYDEKVDMYALGVILFELNCPFRTTFEKSKVRTITSKKTNLFILQGSTCTFVQGSNRIFV